MRHMLASFAAFAALWIAQSAMAFELESTVQHVLAPQDLPEGTALSIALNNQPHPISGWTQLRGTSKNMEQYAAWHESAFDNVIARVLDRIAIATGLPADFLEVQVLTCPSPLARVSDGGFAGLCLDFVQLAETEDELAFVIAHEMTHYLFSDDPIDTRFTPLNNEMIGVPAGPARLETVADLVALDLTVLAGYSPEGALIWLDKLERGTAELGALGHYLSPQLRLGTAYRYVSAHYGDRAAALTSLDQSVIAAQDHSRAYLAEVELAYLFLVEGNERANAAERGHDGLRADACKHYYAGLREISETSGFQEVLLHASIAAFFPCIYYGNTWQEVEDLIATVEYARTSTPALGALALIAELTPNFEIERTLDPMLAELLSRQTRYLQYGRRERVELEAVRKAFDQAQANFSFNCQLHGLFGNASLTGSFIRDARRDMERKAQIIGLDHATTQALLTSCQDSVKLWGNERRLYAARLKQNRMAAGYPEQLAENAGENLSSILAASVFVADSHIRNRLFGVEN